MFCRKLPHFTGKLQRSTVKARDKEPVSPCKAFAMRHIFQDEKSDGYEKVGPSDGDGGGGEMVVLIVAVERLVAASWGGRMQLSQVLHPRNLWKYPQVSILGRKWLSIKIASSYRAKYGVDVFLIKSGAMLYNGRKYDGLKMWLALSIMSFIHIDGR